MTGQRRIYVDLLGTATTWDRSRGVSLYLRSDEHRYLVTDTIGTCYGSGLSPGEALSDWAEAVHSLCAMVDARPSSPRLVTEADRYAKALGRQDRL